MLKRISISPTSNLFIFTEKITLNTIISVLPLPLLILVSILFLHVELSITSIFSVIFICAISTIVFVLIGILIAFFSKTETTAILISILVVIPMMFISGTFTPIEAFPQHIKFLSDIIPMSIAIKLIEGSIIYILDLDIILVLLEKILAYIVIFYLLGLLLIRRGLK